ncbi:hypothetical protein XELAEV_18041919mg, partial [Xenopus laevis]
ETMCHPANGTPVKLKYFATCHTNNVIYLLKCPCGLAYIATDTTVSTHFNTVNQNQSQLRWAILEVISPQNRGGNPKKRILQREAYWIKKFVTLHPKGLNDSWNVKCFL